MNIIIEQNGGANTFYDYESNTESNSGSNGDDNEGDTESMNTEDVVEIYQKRRSYILGTITEDQYNLLLPMVHDLWHGDGSPRSGAIRVRLYKPGEALVYPRELLTTDDYNYSAGLMCYSTEFTCDVVDENLIPVDTYRMFAVDMIWCREDTLWERLGNIIWKE